MTTKNLPISLITEEETRLHEVGNGIVAYTRGRDQQLRKHQQAMEHLKKERLDSQNWMEKNKLTEKLLDKEDYNPQKYLPVFHQADSPYFASFTIVDDDRSIAHQEFLLGKQSLFIDNKAVIVDWRKSAISSLYYEYEEGEEYEEEINDKVRTGTLTGKRRYTIKDGQLVRIECGDHVLEKVDGQWQQAGKATTSTTKESISDHHLCDIVSLISPEQFRLITREFHGCLKLQGSAGAGKTTIALHRLSYLIFNYPEKFREERCLILMFNRTLRNYVAKAVSEMLGEKTPVMTFHSWAATSLKSLGLKTLQFESTGNWQFNTIKKACGMAELIGHYAKTAPDALPIVHLYNMYSSSELLSRYLGPEIDAHGLNQFTAYYQEKLRDFNSQKTVIDFADAGIILRLFQIRTLKKNPDTSNLALNYFDHLVIDEAQDFSQVELECLFNATTREHSLTICADPNQQILNYLNASGLENFQINLQKHGISSEKLQVSYRSTREIMEVANGILSLQSDHGSRRVAPVKFLRYRDREDALQGLMRLLSHYQEKSPNGLIAVICRLKSEVSALYRKLRPMRGVRTEAQRFQPGVLVTNAHQVKGLEFTAVILWNPSAAAYQANNIGDRNLLYVAVSRACDGLAILCHEPPSPYLAKFFEDTPSDSTQGRCP